MSPSDASAQGRVAALLQSADARAAGCWRVTGDRLEQVAFVAGPGLADEVARAFAQATRSVALSQTALGIVQAARTGETMVSRVEELPADTGSGLWLRRFGATRSVAVPVRDAHGTVRAVVSMALAEGSLDVATAAGLILADAAGWAVATGSGPESEPDVATTCARGIDELPSATSPLAPSIHLSAVARIAGLDQIDALYEGREPGFIYARDGHPNASQLAAKVAALEGAEAALVCASGMAAEAAVFLAGVGQGDAIAISDGLYGRSVALVARELARFGVEHRTFDATRPETLRAAITPATRLVFAETLSNPLVRLADIAGLAEVAHQAGVLLVIDHTFAPILCRPIAEGADAVTHSLTKLIGGHSDLTLGLLAGTRRLIDRAAVVASTFGLTGNPFESWLALRGVATLAVRSARACATALDLADRLAGHAGVKSVHYPGRPGHPDHARAARLLKGGFGTIVTIDLGGRSEADAFIRGLRHIPFAPSLGDVTTTLSHPATTSHRNQTAEQWARQGITPGLVRLSIGLEDPDDLWEDLGHALRFG
jgi:cystathionine beta-lyase/cystathionine gamma-synthase